MEYSREFIVNHVDMIPEGDHDSICIAVANSCDIEKGDVGLDKGLGNHLRIVFMRCKQGIMLVLSYSLSSIISDNIY